MPKTAIMHDAELPSPMAAMGQDLPLRAAGENVRSPQHRTFAAGRVLASRQLGINEIASAPHHKRSVEPDILDRMRVFFSRAFH